MNPKFREEQRAWQPSRREGLGRPFGAVIVKDGETIGQGQNRVLLTGCPVYHVEVTAIIDASAWLNPKGLPRRVLGPQESSQSILKGSLRRSALGFQPPFEILNSDLVFLSAGF